MARSRGAASPWAAARRVSAAPWPPPHAAASAQGTEQEREEGCAVGEQGRRREEGKEGEQRRGGRGGILTLQSWKTGVAIWQEFTL